MQYVQGWLMEGVDPGFGNRPGGPVDPGYGVGGGNRPDNSLPPGVPPIGSTLPEQPPGVWPPITWWAPIQPAHPIAGVPVQPGTIWPPVHPPRPDQGLPPAAGHPDQGLPPSPGHPDQGLPPSPGHPDQGLPGRVFWMLAYCPSLGWRFVAVDPSLSVGNELPPHAEPR